MKRFQILLAVCFLSLTAVAQQSKLLGSWVQLDANGQLTTQVKSFLPDGRLLGLSMSSDLKNQSVWFMSNYKVLSDTTYVDHAFYHSSINYQRDYFFTYHLESDSVLVTSYIDYRMNGVGVYMVERWKKMYEPISCNDTEWQELYQKSLVEFDRLPKAGQTVEQYAQELYDKAQGYKKDRKPDRASEALLIRAELDTTNLEWQKDAYELLLDNRMVPSVAEKIANRYIRLKEAIAPVANDTSVVEAYRLKGIVYRFRGDDGLQQFRSLTNKIIDMVIKAGHQPSRSFALDYYYLGLSYLSEGNYEAVYDNMLKCIDILEKAPGISKDELGGAYMMKAVCLSQTNRHSEAIDVVQNEVAPLLVDENGQPAEKMMTMAYPIVYDSYEELLNQNPKDKKLLKAYRQFLSDKLVKAVFKTTEKKFNLFGEYIVLESGEWTIEKPIVFSNETHLLFLKDDQFVDITKEKDYKLTSDLTIVPVDAAKKKEIIKKWKDYRKSH